MKKRWLASLAECAEKIQVCEVNDTVLIINHQWRWNNRLGVLKKFLDEGNIGNLQSIQISFGGGRLCRSGSPCLTWP